jgi:hypothetical protein
MASTDARPVPLKNTAYRHYFVILDSDGDPVSAATGLDSEVSLDGGTFADCTSEATEIGSSGMYYLDLTAAEMNANGVVVIVKTTTNGAKTSPIFLFPQEADDIKVSVTHWGSTAIATPDTAGYPKVTIKAGTGTGEVSLSSGIAASNVTYWNGVAIAAPDSAGYPKVTVKSGTGTGEVSLSAGVATANVTTWNGVAVATPDSAGYPKVTIKAGTGTGEVNLTAGVADANATKIAGSAVSTSTAQLGVNVVNWNASAVAKDINNRPQVNALTMGADSETPIVLTTDDIQGSCTTALNTYDPPTKAELDKSTIKIETGFGYVVATDTLSCILVFSVNGITTDATSATMQIFNDAFSALWDAVSMTKDGTTKVWKGSKVPTGMSTAKAYFCRFAVTYGGAVYTNDIPISTWTTTTP